MSHEQEIKAATPQFRLETRRSLSGNQVVYFPFMALSDVHLGNKVCRAERLAHMLQHTETGDLKAVGDIFDLIHMHDSPEWSFGKWERQVLAHLLRKRAHYFPGNHDEAARGTTVRRGNMRLTRGRLVGKNFAGIRIDDETVYRDPCGRRIKILHGDKYDTDVFGWGMGLWYSVGDIIHAPVAALDARLQHVPFFKRYSVASMTKKIAKTVINGWFGVNDEICSQVDKDPSIDGHLCGHSHMGGISRTPQGKLLLNDGCSTEHVQAMVHDRRGAFALVTWHHDRMDIEEENGFCRTVTFKELGLKHLLKAPRPLEDGFSLMADRLLRILYRLAPPQDRQKANRAQRKAFRRSEQPRASLPLPQQLRAPVANPRQPVGRRHSGATVIAHHMA